MNVQQAVRAMILLLFALFIINLHYSDQLLLLINPKYEAISKIGVCILLILFGFQIHRIWKTKQNENHEHGFDHHHDHGYGIINLRKLTSYSIILLPIVTGLVLPLSTLDASMAEKKGAMLSLTNNAKSDESNTTTTNASSRKDAYNQPDPNLNSNGMKKVEYEQMKDSLADASSINMTDQAYSTYYEMINADPARYEGKEITINGFVYKEDGFESDQLVIGRYLITHCVADSSLIGFLSTLQGVESLAEDTWISVKGTIYLQEYNGVSLPAIKVKDWKEIQQPEQPYVYPVVIKLM
ncbi:TIGR03943 family protein [Gracilibacillus caseinilyticus]|uniref:TIGR03943 family protein n=1 Tax=Gracilibacillus caseinilyticus TaxID=2932256 RepID=A0ABY4EXR4_9BACI|nr:TIGR03943 family protein [Gracilibacillus caseinilyticus]UOQ48647.1 TIGR03943 family protein [Gracilibacillus caseinilyticus]